MDASPEFVGLPLQSIAVSNGIQGGERVAQMTARVQCPGTCQGKFGRCWQRERLLRACGRRGADVAPETKPLRSLVAEHHQRQRGQQHTGHHACDYPEETRAAAGICCRNLNFSSTPRGMPCRFDVQRCRFEAIDPLQQRHGLFPARAALDRRFEHRSRRNLVAALKGRYTGVEQFIAFALALGDRTSRPLDVRPRPGVPAIEKQDTRPDVNGKIVLTGEVVVETGKEKLFNPRVPIAIRFLRGGRGSARSNRVGHPQSKFIRRVARIITPNSPLPTPKVTFAATGWKSSESAGPWACQPNCVAPSGLGVGRWQLEVDLVVQHRACRSSNASPM